MPALYTKSRQHHDLDEEHIETSMNPSTRSRNTSPRFARQRRQEALKRATHRDAWYERVINGVHPCDTEQGEQE